MGKKLFYFFTAIIFILAIFSGLQKAKAAEPGDIIINEIMYDIDGTDDDHEWVELLNLSDFAIGITGGSTGWKFNDGSNHNLDIPTGQLFSVESGEYFILADDKETFLLDYPSFQGQIIDTTMELTNTTDTISLINNTSQIIDTVIYQSSWGANGNGRTLEKNNSTWQESFVLGGTPGFENSQVIDQPPVLLPPLAPSGISPTNFQTIPFTDQVVFQWKTVDLQPQDFEFILFDQLNPSSIIIDEPDLTSFQYKAINLSPGTYYWQIIASNQTGETASPTYTFTLYNPIYSSAIIINEFYPNPTSGEEWIELYNNSNEIVNLNGWHLEDLSGSTHDYTIFNINGVNIGPYQFLIFYRNESGITLNNDSDGVRLIQPNGNILYETPIFSDGSKGWSFARNSAGTWEWTTTTTPTAVNVITVPALDEAGGDDIDNLDIPINSAPISINTGEFRNFENYLVTITGTVIETSGNTFYLDDGSGKAKVYIQDATGIEKPEMHKGDIFEVTGIVNLYRETFRILPQKQEDIQLISTVQKDTEVKISTAKKTTASTTSAKTTTSSNATARSPTDKQIASADIGTIKAESAKSPWWVQLTKAILGLAIILLGLLIFRIIQYRRTHPSASDFGDET